MNEKFRMVINEFKHMAIKEARKFKPCIPRLQKNIQNAHKLETEAWNCLKKV